MSNTVTLIIVSVVILLAGRSAVHRPPAQQKRVTELAITLELERKAAQEKLVGSSRPLSPSPTARCRKTTPRSCNWHRNP